MFQPGSLLNILVAALISTAMVGFGLHGRRVDPKDPTRRSTRWLWIVAGVGGGLFALYVANAQLHFSGGSNQFLVLSSILMFGLLLAFVLIRMGMRGRQVGDHPHCRTCGFDLFGKPHNVMICSECGSDLNAIASTVIGVRQRRMGILLSGVFALIVSLSIGVGVVNAVRVNNGLVNLNQYKPTWLLLRETNGSTGRGNYALEQELIDRAKAGTLSADAIRTLIKRHQADNDPTSYRTSWYAVPLVLRAWMHGTLPDAECQALLDQMNQLTVHPVLATPVVLHLEVSNAASQHGGAPTNDPLTLVSLQINSKPISPVLEPSGLFRAMYGNSKAFTLRLPEPIAVGSHDVSITWDMAVTYAAPGKTPIVISKRVTTPLKLDFVPAAQLTCSQVEEPGWVVRYPASVRIGAKSTSIDIENPGKVPFLGEVIVIDTQTQSRQNLGLVYLSAYGESAAITTTDPMPSGALELELVPRPDKGEEVGRPIETYQKLVRVRGTDLMIVRDNP